MSTRKELLSRAAGEGETLLAYHVGQFGGVSSSAGAFTWIATSDLSDAGRLA